MDGHLVAVEVGVEGRADERVKLDGRTFDEDRLERLDTEAVEGGSAVEEDRAVLDDLVQHVPDFRAGAFDDALGTLDVVGEALGDERVHHERLEEFEGHFLRQAALVEAQLGADNDDRAAGVVDALAEKVLAEAALLALEHVAEALELVVAAAADGAPAAAVVDEAIDGLLEHALLVANDDLGSAEVEQALEAVVAVDDAAIEVVEVAGCEAAAIELDHRAQARGAVQEGPRRPSTRACCLIRGGLQRRSGAWSPSCGAGRWR